MNAPVDMSALGQPPIKVFTDHNYLEFLSQKAKETDVQIMERDYTCLLLIGEKEYKGSSLREVLAGAMRE